MQDEIVPKSPEVIKPHIPTSQEILAAPEGEWQELCELADANIEFYRSWRQRNANPPAAKRATRRQSRPSTSTKGWSAAQVLSRQIGDAMSEAVERTNAKEVEDEEPRTILVNGGGKTLVIEVAQ
jgi:hypothetical protein